MLLPPVYPILDGELLERRGVSLIEAAEALLEGGATLLQLRWKQTYSAEIFQAAEQVAEASRRAAATFVINDRADIAMLLGAGLHVGQDDLPVKEARRLIGDQVVLGYSTHNEAQFTGGDEEPVNYLAIGPIFSTANKMKPDPVVGVAELARLRPRSSKPVVAIGGITRGNAREVLRAGADSVAVIGDLYPEPCSKSSIRERWEEWQQITRL